MIAAVSQAEICTTSNLLLPPCESSLVLPSSSFFWSVMDGSPKTARSAIPKPKIAYDKGEDVRIMEIPPVVCSTASSFYIILTSAKIHAALEPFSVYLRRSGGLLFTCGQVPAITSNLSQASNKPVHRRRADTVASGTPQVAAESQRLHRRGRGRRKNDAYWMAYNKGSDTVRPQK